MSATHRLKLTVKDRKEFSNLILAREGERLASITAQALVEYRKNGGAEAGWFFDVLDSVADRLSYKVELAPAAQRDLQGINSDLAKSDLGLAIALVAAGPDSVPGARRLSSGDSHYWIAVSRYHLTYVVDESTRLIVIARAVPQD